MEGLKFFVKLMLLICLALTVGFVTTTFSLKKKNQSVSVLKKEWYEVDTPRGALVKNASILGNCWVCHATWVKPPDPRMKQPKFAHQEVKLDHGLNDRCFNCHSFIDRNLLQGDDIFEGIMFVNVEKLCGKCHGTVYRRWLEGTHGASRGSWLLKDRFTEKVKCTECHDPHSPKYKYSHFAPSPKWLDKYIRIKSKEHFNDIPYSEFFPSIESGGDNE